MSKPLIVRGVVIHYFTLDEFRCKCNACKRQPFSQDDIDPNLLIALELARVSAGRPLIINSAARCGLHNVTIGGARHSAHLWMPDQGLRVRGVDCIFSGWGPRRTYCELSRQNFAGLGWYDRPGHSPHVHADVDSSRRLFSRWRDQGSGIEYDFTITDERM